MLLRTKLLLFAFFCALIPIFLSTFWSARIASRSIEQELVRKSFEVLDHARVLTRNKIDSLSSYTFLAMSNPALSLAVENQNQQLLDHVAGSIYKSLNLDILEVIDGFGTLVYSAEDPASRGGNRYSIDFVKKLVDENQFKNRVSIVGIEERNKGIAVDVASVLPKVSTSLRGVVLMGFYLNRDFFLDIKQVVNADFCLFSDRKMVSSTFEETSFKTDPPLEELLDEERWRALSAGDVYSRKIRLNGIPCIFSVKKLDLEVRDLFLAVFLSSQHAQDAQRHSMFYIGVAGAIGVGISLLLAVILTRKIMVPVKTLTLAVEEIANGNLNSRVEPASRDEIGFLAYAFNTMVVQLKEIQDRLIRTERLAAIGQLASGVGHELRNPLAAIKNAIYFIKTVLQKSPVGDGQQEAVRQMLDLAEHEINATVKISSDLLEFSRAIRVNPTKVDINGVLNSALSVIRVPDGIRFEKKLGESLPAANVDQERLRQVFINLVNNAIEAMNNAGTLQVETCYNNSAIEVYVRDTGSGIKEEDREKIFEPLFSTKSKGTGLGLAIVKGIIEAHRGQILLKSVVGQGTEFLVRLPVYVEIPS